MITKKGNRFWVSCEPEQYKQIQNMANNAGLSMGQFVLARVLGLKVEYVYEIKEYPLYKETKKGKKEYKNRYVSRKKVLRPVKLDEPLTHEEIELSDKGWNEYLQGKSRNWKEVREEIPDAG